MQALFAIVIIVDKLMRFCDPGVYRSHNLDVAGIEHDIKIWTPTAEEAHLPGKEAEELMARNTSQEREPRHRMNQVMLTPQIIAQLMRMQNMGRVRLRRCNSS